MPNTPHHIRPLALAVIENRGKILAKKEYDYHKREYFYRIPGGGIEFGETSREALHREMREEFSAELEETTFLGILENIFTYQGKPGHEIVFVYKAVFSRKGLYEEEELVDQDSEEQDASHHWFEREELWEANFYPQGIKELLGQ